MLLKYNFTFLTAWTLDSCDARY